MILVKYTSKFININILKQKIVIMGKRFFDSNFKKLKFNIIKLVINTKGIEHNNQNKTFIPKVYLSG